MLETYIRGNVLMSMHEDVVKNYQHRLIHQTWKNEQIPEKHIGHFNSWSHFHPCALHILWTDEDNDLFVKSQYPGLFKMYNSLILTIQKCDMVRLLYLYMYGGVYADLDYEAHANIFNNIPPDFDILIVKSPALINETMQNSLMISKTPGHSFWMRCVESIDEIINFIKNTEDCYKKGWGGCRMLETFHNPLTKKAANLLFTQNITGPAILDKTLVKYLHKKWNIKQLDCNIFFNGNLIKDGVSTHHQSNNWVNISRNTTEIISISIASVLLLCILCVVFTCLVCNHLNKKH